MVEVETGNQQIKVTVARISKMNIKFKVGNDRYNKIKVNIYINHDE